MGNALSSRVKQLDQNLEESENYIRIATAALADTVALQIEESKSRNDDKESESDLSAFDQHVLFLEAQLKEAKIKASQSFQILEDCDQAQESLFCNDKSSTLSTPASTPTDSTISAADTLSRSSSHNTEQLENITNGNVENIVNGNVENVTNGNVQNVTNEDIDENVANGNVAGNFTNVNVVENITNGNVEVDENIANGNVKILESFSNANISGSSSSINEKEANNNINMGSNVNCLKTLISEQDSANANLPV